MKNTKLIIGIILALIIIIVGIIMLNYIFKNDNNSTKEVYNKNIDTIKIYDNLINESGSNYNETDNKHKKNVDAKVAIFMYHNISDNSGNDKYVNNYLSPSKFEEQIKYIYDNNYQTIFVDQLDDLINYKKPVALTFDDGYENFYENAYPILKKYNEKATLNVITKLIDKPNYITSDQITQMKESGFIDIESHTQEHRDLSKISDQDIIKELKDSQNDLKNKFGISSKMICYPSGKYNTNVIEKAKNYYKYGITTKNAVYDSKIDNLLEIPRVRVNRDIIMDYFINCLKKSEVVLS